MSNCCFPQVHLSIQPSIHPSWSSHPHAASSHLQTIQNCQRLSWDDLNPVSVLFLPQRSRASCAESGDFVQLLGGNGIDTSKLLPITDLCISFTGPSELPADPRLLSPRYHVDSERPPDVSIVYFSFSSLSSQLT